MKKIERIHVLSRPSALKPLRHFVRDFTLLQGCCDESIECCVIAINEACMNVMQHVYEGRESEEIVIDFFKDDKDIVIKIYDSANYVDLNSIKSRELDDIRPGGLGVHFISEVMDSVEYKNNDKGAGIGNVIVMRKNIKTDFSQGSCSINKGAVQ